jgi:hypothetical protein
MSRIKEYEMRLRDELEHDGIACIVARLRKAQTYIETQHHSYDVIAHLLSEASVLLRWLSDSDIEE